MAREKRAVRYTRGRKGEEQLRYARSTHVRAIVTHGFILALSRCARPSFTDLLAGLFFIPRFLWLSFFLCSLSRPFFSVARACIIAFDGEYYVCILFFIIIAFSLVRICGYPFFAFFLFFHLSSFPCGFLHHVFAIRRTRIVAYICVT